MKTILTRALLALLLVAMLATVIACTDDPVVPQDTNPVTDPATDPETDPETSPETEGESEGETLPNEPDPDHTARY